jgi:hypothetical protein
VCAGDPRSRAQRRADAGLLGHQMNHHAARAIWPAARRWAPSWWPR